MLCASTARADNFSQEWNETCPTCNTGTLGAQSTFNGIDIFVETPGVTFTDVGGISDVGWAGTLVNPGFDQLTGETVSSLNFNTDLFSANATDYVVLDFYALLNGTVVDSATFTYPVTGQPYDWQVGSLAASTFNSENVTPEPSSLLLLGTGLLCFAGMAYYRRRQQQLQ